jgi:hypothetical protein
MSVQPHAWGMSTTISNSQTAHSPRARSRRAPATRTTLASTHRAAVPSERADDIVIRIPGAQDARPLAELAERVGGAAPQGGLMVAAQNGRLLAAVATGTREALVDPSPSGAAAEAILRHRVAQLHRRRTRLRRPGTPS